MFDFWVASPIKEEKLYSLRRLQDLIRATCLRRTKSMVNKSLELPRRLEKTESIELHQADRELYTYFKEITAAVAAGNASQTWGSSKYDHLKDSNILSLINFLRLICNHGTELLPPSALAAWDTKDHSSFDWQMMQSWRSRCDLCSADIQVSESLSRDHTRLSCEHTICASCARQIVQNSVDEDAGCPKCTLERDTAAAGHSPAPPFGHVRHSAKVEALLKHLREERTSKRYTSLLSWAVTITDIERVQCDIQLLDQNA